MKVIIPLMFLISILSIPNGYSQIENQEIWAYGKVIPTQPTGECKTLFITAPFLVEKANLTNYEKIKFFAEEELKHDLNNGFLAISEFDYLDISVFKSKNKAFESWQRRIDNERKWALQTNFEKYCEPVLVEWTYKGKRIGVDRPYSIYEDGWSTIIEPDSVHKHLELLKTLVVSNKQLDYYNTTIRQRPMHMYKNGKLLEFSSREDNGKIVLNYILFANKSYFLLHGQANKLIKRYADERPYLFEKEHIIDYVKLLINTMSSKDLGRATVITRKRLQGENFFLRQKELEWSFSLSDPKVIFESRNESIISAFVCIDNQLIQAIIELDRKTNKIDLINSTRVLDTFVYDVGKSTDYGIIIN